MIPVYERLAWAMAAATCIRDKKPEGDMPTVSFADVAACKVVGGPKDESEIFVPKSLSFNLRPIQYHDNSTKLTGRISGGKECFVRLLPLSRKSHENLAPSPQEIEPRDVTQGIKCRTNADEDGGQQRRKAPCPLHEGHEE